MLHELSYSNGVVSTKLFIRPPSRGGSDNIFFLVIIDDMLTNH